MNRLTVECSRALLRKQSSLLKPASSRLANLSSSAVANRPFCFLRERSELRPVSHLSVRKKSGYTHRLPSNFYVGTTDNAREVVTSLNSDDRELLLDALRDDQGPDQGAGSTSVALTTAQVKQLFAFTAIPFIGFGLLDNLLMIVAGEYIDHTLGVFLGISTMAAAGLGNILSDVAGIGTAHYVEMLGSRFGLERPVLTQSQWSSTQTRFVINTGRCLGLILGCFIGMFPLFFFNEKEVLEKKRKAAEAQS